MSEPGPCCYCTLEHGGNLFPDLITRLAATEHDGYRFLGVARKTLCASVRLGGLTCDPAICVKAMDWALTKTLASDHPTATWGWFVKRLYRSYREQANAAAENYDPDGLIAEALRDLGFEYF
jgi:hypothetical protein